VDHLLVFFFTRVIFVFVYAWALFTAMYLARESGIPESVQVISAIAGALIPFIFDTIFAAHHLAQKTANNMAVKEKLEHIIEAKRVDDDENTIFVKLKNINARGVYGGDAPDRQRSMCTCPCIEDNDGEPPAQPV
jgi:hypothetical protein